LLATADVTAARRFFSGGVRLGDPTGERDLGKTYDPLALAEIGTNIRTAIPRRRSSGAEAAGDVEAAARLQFLLAADSPNDGAATTDNSGLGSAAKTKGKTQSHRSLTATASAALL
jgi:hypothetical protein